MGGDKMKSVKIPEQFTPIFPGYKLCVEKQGVKQYYYTLQNTDDELLFNYKSEKPPIDLNHTSHVVNGMKKTLSGKVKTDIEGIKAVVEDDSIQEQLMYGLRNLTELLKSYDDKHDEEVAKIEAEKHEEKLKELSINYDKFLKFLEEHDLDIYSFMWYAAEWLAGGESQNTLTGLICHLSTYFKIKPVWFFALGKAGDGKSVIDNASEKLMPDDAFENGRISEAALNRKSKTKGECYLDGKILRMKDFGGDDDLDKWKDTLSRYKELTSDGKTEFEVTSDKVDEVTKERGVTLFTLKGHPSVSLSSINSESFDDQFMRRGVNVSPVATNEDVKKYYYYNKGLINDHQKYVIEHEISLFHDYVEYVKEAYSNVEVINPYWSCLEHWFKDTDFYKTALSLYPSLVAAVTLLNYEFRENVMVNDKEYIISTKQDNQVIADIFNPSQGVSGSAVKVFNLILKWYDKKDKLDNSEVETELEQYKDDGLKIRACKHIFTVGEVKHKCGKIRALKGLPYGEIISSLNNHGFIEPVDKMKHSNKNIYAVSHHEPLDFREIKFVEGDVSKYMEDMCMMYGLTPSHLSEKSFQKSGVKEAMGFNIDLKLPPWVSERPLRGLRWPIEAEKFENTYRPGPQNVGESICESPLEPGKVDVEKVVSK